MLQVESPLVSVNWLQKHIEAENIVVLDATIPKVAGSSLQNNSGYIPKSQFFDIKKTFSDVNARFPNTLPSAQQFQTEAQKLGINKDSLIIVYDQHGIYSSARAWWLFRYFGHENVAVLNGGLPEWQRQGFDTIKAYDEASDIGDFIANVNKDLFTNFEGVNQYSKSDNTLILDARSYKRFSGETPEPRQGLRSGTIVNSLNLPYTELLDGFVLKSGDELKQIFDNLVTTQKKLVFSCGTGITACNLALGATLAGYEDVVVYDGSWTEYGTLTQ
ncbi:sulfurtransferase [Winogradskyella jejuensis]|uniref:Sulfurtransferase n=1 Tax=Winogradskyella jejuensis TaxID=1089305 RepID=A0A1M5UGU1_9FLAO|nr:sulfurtransferase [Winogradskyella jejuensis]SHH62046.1 thiosulfate/3-mercaptopyruvate sulfurtransferase [Winogradskyella jejuensis]